MHLCLQEAGSAQLQKQRKALQEDNRKLQQQLLDAQEAVLQQQAAVAELQHLLAMAERRVAPPMKPQVPHPSAHAETIAVYKCMQQVSVCMPEAVSFGSSMLWRPSASVPCGQYLPRKAALNAAQSDQVVD